MTILIKNKETLIFNDFFFRCSIGKKGFSKNKVEGDLKTPRGTFSIGNLYFRKYRNKKPITKIKCIPIKKNMGWCDDINYPKKYNRLIKIDKKFIDPIKKNDWDKILSCVIEVHNINNRLEKICKLLEGNGFKIILEKEESLKETELINVFATKK